ncbi:Pc16g04090 [Penicillium rubens Wisconsin 54-1255]|uniref:Pc16g04090 protein n=1 Tax=Penicillium rubens (strain ATCC 28089 / DSM 1075 / NRRL 1951 / Wisconsin 54-1255) TaxID=500485 RepID=B6H870_PENRW|nr:Pc16g04090 [Penicillium rubens Wisconsin 54-1255]
MSLLRKPMKQYNWLPDYMQNIYQWLYYCEPTWGYTIYRTTYTPQSNAAFPAANEFNITPWDEIWPNYQPRVIEDASRFDGASIDQLRKHFRADAIERDMLDVFPSYRMFIVIDEESFQTLRNAPFPENSKYEERRYHYVKLVEALEVDLSEDFQGWMKCSLPSLWEIWSDMQDTTYMKDTSSMIPDDTDVL